jgi:hypothetical protein
VYGFRWERWSALAGVLFVGLFCVALALSLNSNDDPNELARSLANSGDRTQQFVAWFLYIASAIAFLSFLGTLRDMLVRRETGPGTLSSLVFGPGVVFTALYIGGVSLLTAPATLADESKFKLDPNTAEMFSDAGYLLLVGGVMVAAVMVLATSTAALRTGVLPRWLGWIGLVVAVVMLLSIYYFPMIIFAGWVLMVSLLMIVMAWKTEPVHPARTTAMG